MADNGTDDMSDKVEHVLSARQTRSHHCHWPGCERQVPPAMWGCKPHWFQLPPNIRRAIWRAYQPGQEQTGRPSEAYVAAAREAQRWIQEQQRESEICDDCERVWSECKCSLDYPRKSEIGK